MRVENDGSGRQQRRGPPAMYRADRCGGRGRSARRDAKGQQRQQHTNPRTCTGEAGARALRGVHGAGDGNEHRLTLGSGNHQVTVFTHSPSRSERVAHLRMGTTLQ